MSLLSKSVSSSNEEKLQKQITALFRKWDQLHTDKSNDFSLLTNSNIRELRIMLCHYLLEIMQTNPLKHGTQSLNALWEKLFYPHFLLTKKLKKTKKNEFGPLVILEYRNLLGLAASVFRRAIHNIYFDFTDQSSFHFVLPFLDAPSFTLPANPSLTGEHQKWATDSLFLCLVHLGDIYRYHLDLKEEHCKLFAQKCYNMANLLKPLSGLPYNALGNLDTSTYYGLSAVYNYLQALTVQEPFPSAANNLKVFLNRSSRLLKYLLSSMRKADQQHIRSGNSTGQKRVLAVKQFVHRFLAIVHHCTFPNSVHAKMNIHGVSRDVEKRFANLLLDVSCEELAEVDRGSPMRLTTSIIFVLSMTSILTLDYYSRCLMGKKADEDNTAAATTVGSSRVENDTIACLVELVLNFGSSIMERCIFLLVEKASSSIQDNKFTTATDSKLQLHPNQPLSSSKSTSSTIAYLRRQKMSKLEDDSSDLSEAEAGSGDNDDDDDMVPLRHSSESEDYETTPTHYGIDPQALDAEMSEMQLNTKQFNLSSSSSRASSPCLGEAEAASASLSPLTNVNDEKASTVPQAIPNHFDWADMPSDEEFVAPISQITDEKSNLSVQTGNAELKLNSKNVRHIDVKSPLAAPSSLKDALTRMKHIHSIKPLLACVKLFCDWWRCSKDTWISLSHNPTISRFWFLLVKIANILLPLTSLTAKLNAAGVPIPHMLGTHWPPANPEDLRKHATKHQTVPLPEDQLTFGTFCLSHVHQQLDTSLKFENALEESILRMEAIMCFICSQCMHGDHPPMMYDFDKKEILLSDEFCDHMNSECCEEEVKTRNEKHDASSLDEEEEPPPNHPEQASTSDEKRMETMRQMAKLRLQNEVSTLEQQRSFYNRKGKPRPPRSDHSFSNQHSLIKSRRRGGKVTGRPRPLSKDTPEESKYEIESDGDFTDDGEMNTEEPISSVYLVPDTYAIMNHLKILKGLLRSRRFVIIIPFAVVNHLDCLKKDNAAARNASRFLEFLTKRGNKFMRVQLKHEVSEDERIPIANKIQIRNNNLLWRWQQIIRCAAYCSEHYRPKDNHESISSSTVDGAGGGGSLSSTKVDDFVCILTDRVMEEALDTPVDVAADVAEENLHLPTEVLQLANDLGATVQNVVAFDKQWKQSLQCV